MLAKKQITTNLLFSLLFNKLIISKIKTNQESYWKHALFIKCMRFSRLTLSAGLPHSWTWRDENGSLYLSSLHLSLPLYLASDYFECCPFYSGIKYVKSLSLFSKLKNWSRSLNQQRQLIIMHKKDLYNYTENQRHKAAYAEQAVLLGPERMGPLSSTPITVGCFPPPVPRAGYAP